jgi:hypothetical protein
MLTHCQTCWLGVAASLRLLFAYAPPNPSARVTASIRLPLAHAPQDFLAGSYCSHPLALCSRTAETVGKSYRRHPPSPCSHTAGWHRLRVTDGIRHPFAYALPILSARVTDGKAVPLLPLRQMLLADSFILLASLYAGGRCRLDSVGDNFGTCPICT